MKSSTLRCSSLLTAEFISHLSLFPYVLRIPGFLIAFRAFYYVVIFVVARLFPFNESYLLLWIISMLMCSMPSVLFGKTVVVLRCSAIFEIQ